MARMTSKYVNALAAARVAGIAITRDQEKLYADLNEAGYWWGVDSQRWDYSDPAASQEPSPLLRIRVWADKEIVEAQADEIVAGLVERGYVLAERSPLYPCRPPKERESRIYLILCPPGMLPADFKAVKTTGPARDPEGDLPF